HQAEGDGQRRGFAGHRGSPACGAIAPASRGSGGRCGRGGYEHVSVGGARGRGGSRLFSPSHEAVHLSSIGRGRDRGDTIPPGGPEPVSNAAGGSSDRTLRSPTRAGQPPVAPGT